MFLGVPQSLVNYLISNLDIFEGRLFDICIVEVRWSEEGFFNLTREDCLLYLFSCVRVETHFPLQVFIKIICRGI